MTAYYSLPCVYSKNTVSTRQHEFDCRLPIDLSPTMAITLQRIAHRFLLVGIDDA